MVLNGIFMSICLPFSWYFGGEDFGALLGSALIAISLGTVMWLLTRNSINKELRKREGYLVVTIGWLVMSLIGTLPYMLSGEITNFTDAFFETLSGFSTTGATILEDIESVSKGILLMEKHESMDRRHGNHCAYRSDIAYFGNWGHAAFCSRSPWDFTG